jgi:hypothetical protein
MLKTKGTAADGRPHLIFGLSRINTERLLKGEPINIDTEELGLKGGPYIVIMAGETEADIYDELKQHVNLPDMKPGNTTRH